MLDVVGDAHDVKRRPAADALGEARAPDPCCR
jgi:hypothetical protein